MINFEFNINIISISAFSKKKITTWISLGFYAPP